MMRRIFPLALLALLAASPAAAQNCSGQPAANTVCAGPTSGGNAPPSFRALTGNDLAAATSWSAQIHQNGGGDNAGHNLMWADQNSDVQADHFTIFSKDQSLITSFTIGGSKTTGNTLTFTFTLASVAYPVVYTVQTGDTLSSIATNIASCINGNAVTGCTGGPAFVAAMLAFHGTDGWGYRPQASANGTRIVMDFPWAASGNSIATSTSGGATETITAGANNTLDIGPYYGCGRWVAGRTPVAGDQPCGIQASMNSGPNTGFDTTSGLIANQYMGGGVGTPYARWVIGAANGSTGSQIALLVGPAGVATADTDGSGNACGTFTGSTIASDPGAGNVSVCGQIFLGMHGQTIAPATAAGVETFGVFRVLGSLKAPSTGVGLELNWSGTNSQILSLNRGTSTYQPLQIQASSTQILPSNSTTNQLNIDSAGLWPNTDNTVASGKSNQRWTNVYAVAGNFSSAVFPGSGSGSVTVAPQATAGTPTLTLPNTSGTFAVGASSPLALSATTGNLTCTTCATTTNGGALTATAPVTISAAGVIALNIGTNLTTSANNLVTVNNPVFSTSVTTPLVIGGTTSSSTLTLQSTSGSGTTDAIIFQTASQNERARFATAGQLLIGTTTPSSSAYLDVFRNAGGTAPSVAGLDTIHLTASDGVSAALVGDSFATNSFFVLRRANGTNASRTAVAGGAQVGSISFQGYDGSQWRTGATVGATAWAGMSGSDWSMYLSFNTVPISSTTLTEAGRFHASGGFSVGTTTDPGIGAILANTSIKSQGATAGIGYATGAGGTVTQGTSRTTGVTLNTVSGDVTLFSTAGSASFQSFTVTNSAVAATDTINVTQKSGADKYQIFVTAVAAGSFVITFATTGGTTSEAPVFHFNVIKGVSS